MKLKHFFFGLVLVTIVLVSGCMQKELNSDTSDLTISNESEELKLISLNSSVYILTDKKEYEQGKEIKITIQNKNEIPIYLEMEYYSRSSKIYQVELEKYENNSWKRSYIFSDSMKCRPGGQGPAIGCVKINEGEKLDRIKPLYYITCIGEFPETEPKEFALSLGKYRLKIEYGTECMAGKVAENKETNYTYSNEFIIKEKQNCRDENYKCTVEDIPCCSGLKEALLTYEDEEGQCYPAVPCGTICLPCGNSICDERESRCNCPEDCP